MLCGTNFEGADLTNVDFSSAYLVHCNFTNAKMEGVQFGQQPDTILDGPIACMDYSKETNLILCGCQDESINLVDFKNGTVLK